LRPPTSNQWLGLTDILLQGFWAFNSQWWEELFLV
jgi:hypothetical protein